jgi:hypothetical protein
LDLLVGSKILSTLPVWLKSNRFGIVSIVWKFFLVVSKLIAPYGVSVFVLGLSGDVLFVF